MTKEAVEQLINQAHPLPRRGLKAYELPPEKYADRPGIDLEGQLEASIAFVEGRKCSMNERKGTTPMSEKLQLRTGEWEEIALKWPDGKDLQNEYGESTMFSLTDGRVLFCPRVCAAKIRALGLKPGERLDIRKAEVRNGGPRPHIEWEVKRVDAPGEQPNGTYVVPKEKEAATVTAAAAPATAIAQPAVSNNNTTSLNGNSPFEHSGHAALLRDTTNMLIDVLANCKNYASKYQGAVAGEDVRTLLLSAYINLSKGPKC